MPITPTELRADLYRILDRILTSGEPVEIERNGRILRIVADSPPGRLARLTERPGFVLGSPDDLVHIDWSGEWRP